MVRLEFAVEIIGDEISYEISQSRFRDHVLKLTADLGNQALHFRGGVQRGANPGHVRKDFATITASFSTLVQSMRHAPEAFLTHRAIARAGRLLDDVSQQLKRTIPPVGVRPPVTIPRPSIPGQAPVVPGQAPIVPRQAPVVPGQATRPLPELVSIPKSMKGIALLPKADQAAALAQKTCPVTGDLLGADGKPLTVQVGGKTVYVCCDDCVNQLKANPSKFLKKRP